MKKSIIIIITILILIVISIFAVEYFIKEREDEYVQISFVYDVSTPEKLVGASKYVAVIKVNEIWETRYIDTEYGYSVYTIYDAVVIENIKGNLVLNTPILIAQEGGIKKDGITKLIINNNEKLSENTYYLMATGVSNDINELIVTDSNRIIKIGENLDNDIINTYKNAVQNEILPDMPAYEYDEFFTNKSVYDNAKTNLKDRGIDLSVSDITPTGLNLTITQNDGSVVEILETNESYYLEKNEYGSWENVDYKTKDENIGWNSAVINLPINGEINMDINWEKIYGELEEGNYRLTKQIFYILEDNSFDYVFHNVEFFIE